MLLKFLTALALFALTSATRLPDRHRDQLQCTTNAECLAQGRPLLKPKRFPGTPLDKRATRTINGPVLTTYTASGGVVTFTVRGGRGGFVTPSGRAPVTGGRSVIAKASFNLDAGQRVVLVAAGRTGSGSFTVSSEGSAAGSGGGGSFVYAVFNDTRPPIFLLNAGGGGGAIVSSSSRINGVDAPAVFREAAINTQDNRGASSGGAGGLAGNAAGGGAGFNGDGQAGGGFAGGRGRPSWVPVNNGAFGGGGSAQSLQTTGSNGGGGGGGGYSGGNGGLRDRPGEAGSSFVSIFAITGSTSIQAVTDDVEEGYVIVTDNQ